MRKRDGERRKDVVKERVLVREGSFLVNEKRERFVYVFIISFKFQIVK